MIQQKLLELVEANKTIRNPLFVRTLLKEALQDYILNFVYNDQTYKKLLFTGGTCLRKVYGLPRLSEDLDFDFVDKLDIRLFAKQVGIYFAEKLQYKDLETKISGNENTVFFKFPILKEIGLGDSSSDTQVLFVRCDFFKETSGVFETEINQISTGDFTFYALSYNLPTLFANKIIAFLSREFFKGSRQSIPFKGRDVFDLVWFIEKSTKREFAFRPYWKRIFKKLNVKSKDEVLEAILNKVKSLDKKNVHTDLLPFIASIEALQNFTDHFSTIVENKLMYLK